LQAAEAALALAQSLGPDDRLVCLISGGGSALMSAPLAAMDPDLKMRTHRALLASGATISELNTVRKQLSLVKGGRLAEACQGHVLNFLVSDVPGDRVEFIASGPTVPANTNQSDAIEVLKRYQIDLLDELLPWLSNRDHATPQPDADCFQRVTTTIVAAPSQSLKQAQVFLESKGVECWLLGDSIEGDSVTVARVMAETALWQRRHRTLERPLCLLSGGETTVKVVADGIGGPNAHFALALLDALEGARGISAIVCDTDGVDGGAQIAGALIDDQTLMKARRQGLDHRDAMSRQDAHTFFQSIGQSVIPGPTGTNVNDFRAILIEP
jgi:hydroxypyruvate reductase